jgi:hypothetical protein
MHLAAIFFLVVVYTSLRMAAVDVRHDKHSSRRYGFLIGVNREDPNAWGGWREQLA